MYAVQPGDSYFSVSISQQLATNQLINANGLTYNSSDFPASGSLCISNQCSIYVVKADDTCSGILTAVDISYTQLMSWNPAINGLCSNLGPMVGQTLCLSNPLGDFAVVNNTNSGGSYTTPAPVPASLPPNTTTNCGLYYTVQPGDECVMLSVKYNIPLKDFYFLNPHINSNCTNLWLDSSYCVAPVGSISTYPGYGGPTSTFTIRPASTTPMPWVDFFSNNRSEQISIPIANETRTDCWDYIWINETLGSDYSCWDVASFSGLSREQFILWNPSLDKNTEDTATRTYDYDCTLQPASSYCNVIASPTPAPVPTVVPPSPRAAGEISNCTAWLQVGTGFTCEI